MALHGLNTVINSYRFSGLGPAIFQSSVSKAGNSDIQILTVWTTMWTLMGSGLHSRCLKGVSRLTWVPSSIPWASFWLSILGIRKYAQLSGDWYTQLQLLWGFLKVFSCCIPTDLNLNKESDRTGLSLPALVEYGKKGGKDVVMMASKYFSALSVPKTTEGLADTLLCVRADLWQLCFPRKRSWGTGKCCSEQWTALTSNAGLAFSLIKSLPMIS